MTTPVINGSRPAAPRDAHVSRRSWQWLRRPFALTVTLIAAFFVALTAGAVFLPLATGPDEPGHYVHAAAVVRGQAADLTPTVPAAIDNLHRFAGCLAFHPEVTAVCQDEQSVEDPLAPVVSDTAAGLYNPVFYAWTGIGSLLDQSESGLYYARILSALVTATIFGWAASYLIRTARSRWAPISLFVVCAPLVLYIGSVLNPSAWEIAGAFAVVVSAWGILAARHPDRSWSEAHSLLAIAGAVMIVSRGLSPVLFALLILMVVILAGWKRVAAALRRWPTWAVVGVVSVVGAASLLWVAVNGTNYVGIERPATLLDGIRAIPVLYADTFGQLSMMYGSLGWLDVPPPQPLVIMWVIAVGAFAFVGFAGSQASGRFAIALAAAVCVLLPGVVAGIQWSGLDWQGRYTFPLVAGLLAVSAVSVDEVFARDRALPAEIGRRLEAVGTWAAVAVTAIGYVWMLVLVAKRYLMGYGASLFSPPTWLPPVPPVVLGVLSVGGFAAFGAIVLLAVWSGRANLAADDRREAAPVESTTA